MKDAPTQLDMREDTALSRRYASPLAVDSLPSMSNVVPKGVQHRPLTPVFASRASETDKSFITMSLEAATGEETGDCAEVFSVPAAAVNANQSRRIPVMLEPFVSADQAAQFLCVKRRFLLELARRGIAGAYALGTGNKRKIWVFRLSELAASVARTETPIPNPPKPCTIKPGSPR
jgi:hypothetical protein